MSRLRLRFDCSRPGSRICWHEPNISYLQYAQDTRRHVVSIFSESGRKAVCSLKAPKPSSFGYQAQCNGYTDAESGVSSGKGGLGKVAQKNSRDFPKDPNSPV